MFSTFNKLEVILPSFLSLCRVVCLFICLWNSTKLPLLSLPLLHPKLHKIYFTQFLRTRSNDFFPLLPSQSDVNGFLPELSLRCSSGRVQWIGATTVHVSWMKYFAVTLFCSTVESAPVKHGKFWKKQPSSQPTCHSGACWVILRQQQVSSSSSSRLTQPSVCASVSAVLHRSAQSDHGWTVLSLTESWKCTDKLSRSAQLFLLLTMTPAVKPSCVRRIS